MFCLSASNKRIIASLLVAAFGCVFARQVLCNFIPHHQKEEVVDHHATFSSGPDNHHLGDLSIAAHHHHGDTTNEVAIVENRENDLVQLGEQFIPKEECCREATATVLSGIAQPPKAEQAKHLLDVVVLQHGYNNLFADRFWSTQKSTLAKSLLRQVRPKIPDLRVLIGVFLI